MPVIPVDETLDISHVSGNAPDIIKRVAAYPSVSMFAIDGDHEKGTGYSDEIVKRMVVTEVSIVSHPEEPSKKVGRVVCEMEVHDDMVNRTRTIHGGCSAYLVDICSSIALTALALSNGRSVDHVSQSLNMVYHSPATVGDKLRIVNTTMTMGSRTMSVRTEIWNATRHRLVASGVHIKMQPSESKL
ncbi:hypothetical protein E1B28_009733 [Marasmius oreades]|uniref:Thioesterase domain-containing protein n=1 Tax=Marasmius oreades TaxID=181124 RepID=A0A9P7US00_9AGAR|nr:uncharacterized protein E1B28_009733 [Marasmius oreades]KAG7090631.1 hypothetical protein E1B28_009733 [Marasmius oreades]